MQRTGFRVRENAAPLKQADELELVRNATRFRVRENAAPLKQGILEPVKSRFASFAFVRTRPH